MGLPRPYYEADGVTLYHGDCLDILPLLTERFDLVFTSPPYNMGHSTGGGVFGARGGGGKWQNPALAGGYGAHDDNMNHDEYVAWQRTVIATLWRVLSESGAIFYNHKPRIFDGLCVLPTTYLPNDMVEFLRQELIWARAGGINFSPSFYLPTHERILVIAKTMWRLKSKGASGVGDVWAFSQEMQNPHPAPFPIELPARAIETCAPTSVLDPFSGSGTTLRAAKNAGVRGVGIELEERFCEQTAERLSQGVLEFGGVV